MFAKIKLKNILKKKEKKIIYSKVTGGSIVDVQFKRSLLENKFYNFAGICIAQNNKGLSTTVKIRNVISLYPLEYTFTLYSPMVNIVKRQKDKEKKNMNIPVYRAKLYYLRKKPAPMSKINFHYLSE